MRPYFKSDLRSSSQCRSAAHHTNPRRERRHPVTPYVSILRALVPFLAACSCIASAADDYDVQLVARTGQGFISFDQRVSINDSGWVAFVGQDSSDSLSKVFVNSLGEGVWSSGVNSIVSIFCPPDTNAENSMRVISLNEYHFIIGTNKITAIIAKG